MLSIWSGRVQDFTIDLNRQSKVAHVRMQRAPHNFLDAFFLKDLCDALVEVDADPDCHCMMVSAEGRSFSAGRDFSQARREGDTSEAVYGQAVRLMALESPLVAAVQGAAVGAGMGLAMVADVRLCSDRAYFSPNFVAHGLHHGFGLSTTLAFAVGPSKATEMLMTGRRYAADEALAMGLVSAVTDEAELLSAAMAAAEGIAKNPRAALRAIRRTMRGNMIAAFADSVAHECAQQAALLARAT